MPAIALELPVSAGKIEARRRRWKAPRPREGDTRGYRKLFLDTVTQADRACDFDFLAREGTIRVPR